MELQTSLIERCEFSPPPVVTQLAHREKRFFVVREDLLPGGTKQRAAGALLQALSQRGFTHFIYASPFAGFAQVALSYVCAQLGLKCTLFVESIPGTLGEVHEFTSLAARYGANIRMQSTLLEAEKSASMFAQNAGTHTYKIPLGFDCAEFKKSMRTEIEKAWASILEQLPQAPKKVWLPVGSGTLANIFASLIDVGINCVDVHVLKPCDSRLQRLTEFPNIKYYSSNLAFAEPATEIPDVPSNLHYDAKLWEFIAIHGQDGDLWWNVAR